MLPEDDIVVQMDHIHDVFGVVLLQELQNLELHARLVVVLLLVLDDLDANFLVGLVVDALDGSAEGAFAKGFDNLEIRYIVGFSFDRGSLRGIGLCGVGSV